jgi:uncharacterized protein YdhG (YjbR/CyaY superfamily)
MKTHTITPTTIDEYIIGFPPEVQALLVQMRRTIRHAAPEAEETIKYALPTYLLQGNLVFFGAFKQHIGFYPEPSAIKAFQAELGEYTTSKGAIQFPFDKPLPLALVAAMVKFRVEENLMRADEKRRKKLQKKTSSEQA